MKAVFIDTIINVEFLFLYFLLKPIKGAGKMNQEQFELVKNGKGFIAALDQSGGSTPKALAQYGVSEDSYSNEDEMYDLIHEMRTRVMTAPAFNSESILGAIL